MEPELEEHRAFGDQHALEAADAAQALLEARALVAAHDAAQDRIGVPRAEDDADLSLRRHRLPETPHLGAVALDVAQRAEGVGVDVARVHPFVEEVHGLALAGAVDAVHEHDDGERLVRKELVLRLEQLRAELLRLLVVRGVVDLVTELGGLEHALSFSLPQVVGFSGRRTVDRPSRPPIPNS